MPAVAIAGPVAGPAAPATAPGGRDQHAVAAPNTAQPAPAPALLEAAADVPSHERRINWYGLSLDLSDVWSDETNYAFESPSASIHQLVFAHPDLQPAQVQPSLEAVRRKVDGAYGTKPSGVLAYENPSYSVLGVQIRIGPESLYSLFATADEQVVGITARCRSECDSALRGIVRSLKKAGTPGTGPAQKLKGAQHRYSALGLTFDSTLVFETPDEFTLANTSDPHRVSCKRQADPPADNDLPPPIHWSYQATEILAKTPRIETTLTGKSGDARAAIVRLYRREAIAPDGAGDDIPFSSNSAVISLGHEFLHCKQLAGPSSPELVTRFHRLFESARYE